MFDILPAILALAIVDSINPTAMAVTIYLVLTDAKPVRKSMVFLATMAASYFVVGVALMSGFTLLQNVSAGFLHSEPAYVVQGVLGVGMILYGTFAPKREGARRELPTGSTCSALALLGVTITFVEFLTAVPYLGAIGLMSRAELPALEWLPLLVLYNFFFVAVPLLILAAYALFGARLEGRLGRIQEKIHYSTRGALLWVISILGVVLALNALFHFKLFGLVPEHQIPRF